MSQTQKKSPLFRHTLSVCAAASLLGMAWIALTPGSEEPELAVPSTAALSVRSSAVAPIELDAMVKNVASNRCFDMDQYTLNNGDPVQQWDCNNTLNQRVWVDSVPDSNSFRLRLQHSGKCLEPASNQSGAGLLQWVCHSGDYERPNVASDIQHWYLNDLGQSRFSIVHVSSGLALTSTGTNNGAAFVVEPWTGSNSQRFEYSTRVDHETSFATMGHWGDLIAWPHVPVHAAITPDNKVVTWASNELDDYPQDTQNKFSWSSVYDPASGSFLETNNPSHDMFCAGTTLLEDGSLLASGGNPQASETSHFDPESNSWSLRNSMSQERWYGTNVVTGSGDVFTTFAKGAQEIPELFSIEEGAWRDMPGADMSVLRDEQDLGNQIRVNSSAELQWYAFMHTSPDGRVFQSGPMASMHWYDTSGQGALQEAGTRMGESRSRQFGSAVMYDVGKLLLTGGSDPSVNDELSPDGRGIKMGATDSAMTIDISGAAPKVEPVAAMNSRRANHNGVVLPNGEVFVVGGTEWGLLFDDRYTAWWPEIWNPENRQWRTVAAISTPRAYHSWALLLQDGRVLSGGGGLCGDCSANHPDAQIYTPPYLFQSNGQLASRPLIEEGTTESKVGGMLSFKTDQAISQFNMVRLSSVTHSINTDQRFIPLDAEEVDTNVYAAQLSSNVNVMIPGMYWVFAIDAETGVPSEGHLLQVKSTDGLGKSVLADALPDGELQVKTGESVSIQLSSSDFEQSQLNYSVLDLPEGLSFDESAGVIKGRFSAPTEGSFLISLSDGNVQTTERVEYEVRQANGSIGGGGGGTVSWLSLLLLAFIPRTRNAA